MKPEDTPVDDGLGWCRMTIGRSPHPGTWASTTRPRVDFDRLRRYRLERAQKALAGSECGAFLLFDFYNIRYTTQTWIGGALGDKMTRYALLTRGSAGPTLWDFGSAARHHKLYAPWLGRSPTAGPACSACAAPSPRRPA